LSYLSSPTEEGIAYKIDMQLRPSGKAGPIVCSLDAYRDYHKNGAQLWERQALIKTRFVAGDAVLGQQADKIIDETVYSSGLPAGGAEQIHHLRMRMERELAGEDETRFNLKKGRGGLVDIEFLAQMLQLAHGQRFRELRRRATLEALQALEQKKIITKSDYQLLSEGYLFLRRLDHRLRIERDRSIDTFEAEPGQLDSIARALGYRGNTTRSKAAGEKLLRDYRSRRDKIRQCYDRYFVGTLKEQRSSV
jgi:glutamate-ammonia-ligase adenylyltransferase